MNTFSAYINKDRDEIIRHIQELVQINSVQGEPLPGMPFGEGPSMALAYVLELGRKLGFDVKNFDGYAGHVEFGQGPEILGVLAHVDVVPELEGWKYPPFSGTIEDGKIYGRGSYDDKGACIAMLFALKAIKESGMAVHKRIRLIYGANEETGMADIPYYLSKEEEPHLAFSPDAPFPVIYGEKGILELKFTKTVNSAGENRGIHSIRGGTSVKKVAGQSEVVFAGDESDRTMIGYALKNLSEGFSSSVACDAPGRLWTITIVGKEAYAASPEKGKNAIAQIMRFLANIDGLAKELRTFIEEYNHKIGEDFHGEKLHCNFADLISTPLTLTPGLLCYEDGKMEMQVHIRYPITTPPDQIFENIRQNFTDEGTQIEVMHHNPAHHIDKDSCLVQELMCIYKEETGDEDAQPMTMTGGTYARTLRNAVAFGPLFPGEKQVAHEVDEYLWIDSIIRAAKIYSRAMFELAQ